MKNKVKPYRKRLLTAVLALIMLLQAAGIASPGAAVTAEAAGTSGVRFAKSIQADVRTSAQKQNATSKIAVAKVRNYTYLYKSASTGSRVVGYMYRGSGAYIIRRKKSFYYVTSGNAKGWVKMSSVVTGSSARRYVAETNPRVATAKETSQVVAGAGKSSVIATIQKGRKLTVLKKGKTWVKVRVDCNTLGYIRRDSVTIEKGLYTAVTSAEERRSEGTDADQSSDTDGVEPNTSSEGTNVSGKWKSLGTFKLTAYCPGSCCNGSWAGQTATGVKPRAKHTIAVDRRVIPLGSKIRIEGDDTIYVAEDTGVSGKHIDIFMSRHSLTTKFGVKYRKVYILKN